MSRASLNLSARVAKRVPFIIMSTIVERANALQCARYRKQNASFQPRFGDSSDSYTGVSIAGAGAGALSSISDASEYGVSVRVTGVTRITRVL